MATKATYIVGQVMRRGVGRPDTLKVQCTKLKLNSYLLKYYNHLVNIWAKEDGIKKCKVGDIVLIKKVPNQITPRVSHIIEDIIYPVGNVTDPVTGRRCRGIDYVDEERREKEVQYFQDEAKNRLSKLDIEEPKDKTEINKR